MSIILKGIDMPKCSNEDIMVVIRRDKAEVWQTGYKERTVEAIQIPTPPGRLIDADKLRATLRRWTEDEWNQKASPVSWAYAYEDLIDLIDDAPTILEEEK